MVSCSGPQSNRFGFFVSIGMSDTSPQERKLRNRTVSIDTRQATGSKANKESKSTKMAETTATTTNTTTTVTTCTITTASNMVSTTAITTPVVTTTANEMVNIFGNTGNENERTNIGDTSNASFIKHKFAAQMASKKIDRMHEKVTATDYLAVDLAEVENIQASIGTLWHTFEDNHMDLLSPNTVVDWNEHVLQHETYAEKVDQIKLICRRQHARLVASQSHTDAQANVCQLQAPMAQLQLKPLAIPQFDGEAHNWLTFKTTFETMVHQSDMADVLKFAQLRKALGPKPLAVINGMQIGAYQGAWEALLQRYNNVRVIINAHLNRFFGLPTLTRETNEGLRNIIDITRELTRSLETFNIPVNQWNVILEYVILNKLPTSTTMAWRHSEADEDFQPIENLLEFLENRARAIDHARSQAASSNHGSNNSSNYGQSNTMVSGQSQASTSTHSHKQQQNLPKTKEGGKCPHCGGEHELFGCSNFLKLNVQDRFQAMKSTNVCFNCFKPGHSGKQCKHPRSCKNCNGRHNTLLCKQQAQTDPTTTPSAGGGAGQQTHTQSSTNSKPPRNYTE